MSAGRAAHLLIALCVAACRQKRRVRFATAATLVNELVEAGVESRRSARPRSLAKSQHLGVDDVDGVAAGEGVEVS